MLKTSVWRWIDLVAFACMLLVNVLAEAIPIGGNTTAAVSAANWTPLTPAGISFCIWILIYLYFALFIVMQFICKSESKATDAIGPWFLISCLANIGWIFAWHYRSMLTALLFMAALLVSLIVIESKLRGMRSTAYQRWIVRAPFSIYYGWITVAAIANVSAWLFSIRFTGFGLPSQVW